MRILHVLDHSLPFQSGYVFRSLSIFRAQRLNGWETLHLTTPKQNRRDVAREEVDGWTFHRTAMRQLPKLPVLQELGLMQATSRRIEQLVREFKPDVIHAHSPLLDGYPALRVARRHGIPVVYEVRAFWEDAAVDHGTTREGSLRYNTTRHLETRLLQGVDLVTTICEGLRGDILARGIDPAKVVVAPNVVDAAHFAPARQGDPVLRRELGLEGKVVLGFIGSFYAYEGVRRLVETLPALLERHADVALLLVGGGSEFEAVRGLVERHGLAAHVALPGRVPHGEVQRYYDLVDAFVYPRLPMRLTELVTPLKPLEAMAARRLVVASDVGGHRELIRDGETGFLFDAKDGPGLLDTLTRVLESRALWPRIIEQGNSFVREQRSLERLADIYKQAFAGLAKGGRAAPGTVAAAAPASVKHPVA
jgi:PEP-CTERM/exosortase A-associated glycosyltransferase